MRGSNHIMTGISAAIVTDACIKWVSTATGLNIYNSIRDYLNWGKVFEVESQVGTIAITASVAVLNTILFILGCLLPDVDQENSTLGRIIHIPVKHRTWTHTIWLVIALAVASVFLPCISCLTYGCTLHIFFDSLSKGGICWFYPISKYKIWTSGAQVKKNHKIYLYRTGETSEVIITTLVVLIGASVLVYNILLTAGVSDLPFHGV